MDDSRTRNQAASVARNKDEWEDWSDEDPVTPIEEDGPPLIDITPAPLLRAPSKKPQRSETKMSRLSVQKPQRLKSRLRQRAQNAKAGIKLDTSLAVAKLRPQHIAHQLRTDVDPRSSRTGKFVDAAALKALEGSPNSASVGSFAWLRKKNSQASRSKKGPTKHTRTPSDNDLSPNDRPIVIGISMPEDDLAGRIISPHTATIETPVEFPLPNTTRAPAPQQVSVWSPDTPATASSFRTSAASASFYSSHSAVGAQSEAPPVPQLPANFARKSRRRTTIIVVDEDDADTPITLFEGESPVLMRKSTISKNVTRSPVGSSVTQSQGWWNQVVSPIVSPSSPEGRDEAPAPARAQPDDRWWEGVNEKRSPPPNAAPPPAPAPAAASERSLRLATVPRLSTVASSSRSTPEPSEQQSHAEKARILLQVNQEAPANELPPPYEPPSRGDQVRYRAVFPPGHPLNQMFPPSPGPVSPAMAGTMTSQGAIRMADVPLTPARTVTQEPAAPLPARPQGSFVPVEHFFGPMGRGSRQNVERQRRRHEKEDAIARKVGGLWKGRGCLPANGCYGRAGREGRKKRRIMLGIIAGVLALIILVIILATTLTRKRADPEPYSMWLNLTDFPPIPTGVTTIITTDKADTATNCVVPSTLWSCDLPKELAKQPDRLVPGADPSQPNFYIQIQFDNSTQQLWRTPNRVEAQGTKTKRSFGGARLGRRDQQFDPGFSPSPSPPSFAEMFFLGNTTDGIVGDEKAGEPTPFYISMLGSLNQTVGPNMLSRRATAVMVNSSVADPGPSNSSVADSTPANSTSNGDDGFASLLPPPDNNPDGSAALAKLFAFPTQQPLRLYDRGLPTEHYGFYSYYDKTIYVQSVLGSPGAAADGDGGSPEASANFVVTWSQARFKVEIWTRALGTTKQLLNRGRQGTNATQPGTMPYPVTVTLDTHGGETTRKAVWSWNVTAAAGGRAVIDTSTPRLVLNDRNTTGDLVSPQGDADLARFGGIDGGTGGCRCGYRNYIGVNGNQDR